jgi:predicted  nucleic acid-binding Zn-ribbon protein
MPHQCIRCGKEYPDKSNALLNGCSCGAKFFFFFREKMPEGMKINNEQREQVLEDVISVIRSADPAQAQRNQRDGLNEPVQVQNNIKEINEIKEEPVIIDLESIKVTKGGKYTLDLAKLFARNPVIYKTGEGKYTIDIDSTFKLMEKKK